MFHSGPVKEEFSQTAYQMLPYWKSWSSKNKSIRYEALVEEVHETDSTEFIKDQTLASSDRNLTGFSPNPRGTTNGFLVSRSLPFKCIFILHRHHAKHCKNPLDKKNSDLVKDLKTLLLSLAVCDLGVGLPTPPMGTLDSRTQTKGRKWASFELSKFILGSEALGNKIE